VEIVAAVAAEMERYKMTYQYNFLSQNDKIVILKSKIYYLEGNLYSLSINKIEAEKNNDGKGLAAVEEEIQKCIIFIDQLYGMLNELEQ
jgi:hypothetical protein